MERSDRSWQSKRARAEDRESAVCGLRQESLPPDANFNLRISYGRVLGYEEDTTLVPYKTTFFGLYDRARSFDEKPPYDLPKRYPRGQRRSWT